jgi:hypothetical protein
VLEQERCRHTLITSRTGHEHGAPHAQRLDHQRPRAPLDLLAAIISPLGAPRSGVLTD